MKDPQGLKDWTIQTSLICVGAKRRIERAPSLTKPTGTTISCPSSTSRAATRVTTHEYLKSLGNSGFVGQAMGFPSFTKPSFTTISRPSSTSAAATRVTTHEYLLRV